MNKYGIIAAVSLSLMPLAALANGETHQCPDGSWVYNPSQCPTPPVQPNINVPVNVGNEVNVGVQNDIANTVTNRNNVSNVNTNRNDNRNTNTNVNNNRNQAIATNRQQQQQRQQQGQQQSIRGSGNSYNNIDLSNRQSAASAIAPTMISNDKADITSAAISTVGWGASIGKVRPLNYEEVTDAEDRWVKQGLAGGLIYMSGRDNAAIPVSEYYGVTESSQAKRDRGIAQREASTRTRFAAPEHTGSTPLIARKAQPVVATRQAQAQPATPTCPQGSSWDGKGCWASNLSKVVR